MNALWAELPTLLAAHLGLTLAALALGVLVSVPLGIAISRSRRLEGPILAVASVIQTVPSLALLAFMVPLLAALGARSIGYLPALIGLFLYSLLPVLQNTVTGLSGVDRAVIEASRGVGMTPREALFRVELPLALPVIVAGIRTSAVWTVGTATLATPVGAKGLGDYIFTGLQTRNYQSVLLGCAASAALAISLDGLVRALSHGVVRRSRRMVTASLAAFAALAIFAMTPALRATVSRGASPLTIGAKTFTEQYILSRILAGGVTRATGAEARTLDSLGSTVAFDALKGGQIDAYVDYSGTIWATILGHTTAGSRKEVLAEVKRELDARYGIKVAAALGFENTYALAMRRADARRIGIATISDLARHAPGLRMAGDYEIFGRAEWRSIEGAYALSFAERRRMDPSLLYEALRTNQVDVISAYSTDGRISAYDLETLDDDRGAIPPYDAVVLVSAKTARERPEVLRALSKLEGAIDADRMRRMNAEVDDGKLDPAAVAARFLDERPR